LKKFSAQRRQTQRHFDLTRWIPAFAGMTAKIEAPMNKQPCVYLLASKRNGTLYAGVTSDLVKRVWEHKNHVVDGFTKQYEVDQLVWYEVHETMESAIQREKAIKEWQRVWKIELIEKFNPDWKDLYDTVC
jgi:putative endonuclease